MSTIQEKIASLPHVDVIKAKITKDVMYFRTNNPDTVIKVRVIWDRISVSERIAQRQALVEQRTITNDEELHLAMMEHEVADIQSRIDAFDAEHETWD